MRMSHLFCFSARYSVFTYHKMSKFWHIRRVYSSGNGWLGLWERGLTANKTGKKYRSSRVCLSCSCGVCKAIRSFLSSNIPALCPPRVGKLSLPGLTLLNTFLYASRVRGEGLFSESNVLSKTTASPKGMSAINDCSSNHPKA